MIIGRDYIGVSAGAVIFHSDGKILLAQRGGQARDDVGRWEFPGGSVRPFERREDTVKRVFLEKHGLEIEPTKLLGVYDVIDDAQGDHWVSTTYLGEVKSGVAKVMVPEKCLAIGWFALPEIEGLELSRITRLNLEDLKKRLLTV